MRLSQILGFNKEIMVLIGKTQLKIPHIKAYNYVKQNDFLSTIGSSNLFEIAQNQGNAAKQLKVKIDDEIKLLF
jgi:S-adenosylmethionine hydrolase